MHARDGRMVYYSLADDHRLAILMGTGIERRGRVIWDAVTE